MCVSMWVASCLQKIGSKLPKLKQHRGRAGAKKACPISQQPWTARTMTSIMLQYRTCKHALCWSIA